MAAAARPARTRLIPAHAGKTTPPPATPRARRAHPRSRGENKRPWRSWLRPAGSSPLTRGKHQIGILDSTDGRLIPAHAGKTRSRRRNAPGRKAHPRSRGENRSLLTDLISPSGSSPLTRGKLVPVLHYLPLKGLIPAHAGKTWTRGSAGAPRRAHPRSRGENQGHRIFDRSDNGSSPLTRGKRSARAGLRSWRRLIPAHAGKTRD